MNIKSNKDILIKKNLKLILDAMMPGDDFMPPFTKAVRVQTIIKKLKKSKFLYDLKLLFKIFLFIKTIPE